MLAVATTQLELPAVRTQLAELGMRSFSLVAPSDVRRVVLARFDDPAATERTAAALRAAGLMAVTRPDGGAALDAWFRDTRPVTVDERLTVCMAWSEHDRTTLTGLIELGPGGFGNGRHATTLMLLEELAERIKGGERLLDVGCGSGVLALGGLQLGAAAAVAFDRKPAAIEATRRNAELNGMAELLESTATPLEDLGGGYDVVVANVARAGIVSLAPDLVASVGPGGWLAVSGITPAQCEPVAEFLRPLNEIGRRTYGEWASLVFS